jgi:hypothetical protein
VRRCGRGMHGIIVDKTVEMLEYFDVVDLLMMDSVISLGVLVGLHE